MVMDRSEDLRDKERWAHWEINEDGVRSYHQGYEITYCNCKRPIIHSRMVKIEPNCGRKKCNDR